MVIWQCGPFSLPLDKGPLIMGILNATPDSFSDGYPQLKAAIRQAERMAADGADILDVGGESTRPGSDPVSAELELQRVVPLIEHLARELDLPISVDTRRPEVARAAIDAGAHIVNHVSASLDWGEMLPVLRERDVGYVAMHMKAAPKTMQKSPVYDNVTDDIGKALARVGQGLGEAGISADRLLYDPGIGFGKTLEHNLTLLRELPRLVATLNRPILMGLSRKSWLTHFFEDPLKSMDERDAYTAVASALLPFDAAPVHRVHNVALVKRALKLAVSLKGQV